MTMQGNTPGSSSTDSASAEGGTSDRAAAMAQAAAERPPRRPRSRSVYRHSLPVRIMHWINVIAITLMFFSGLQIFNARPNLYWGNSSDFDHPLLTLGAQRDASGKLVGVTQIGDHTFNTTGVLGVSDNSNGQPVVRGFPSWLTVPGPQWLAMGRRWHFFFAWVFVLNGLCYITYSLIRKHLQRDLWPTRSDWRGFGKSLWDHVRLRHPTGEDALRYNILQKLTYLIVIFVFGTGIVLMGLAMSPRMDTVLKPLLELVGGRQSARTIHFIIAWAFVAFVLIHVFEVLISGAFNHLRGMITGHFKIKVEPPGSDANSRETTDEESSHE